MTDLKHTKMQLYIDGLDGGWPTVMLSTEQPNGSSQWLECSFYDLLAEYYEGEMSGDLEDGKIKARAVMDVMLKESKI